MRLFRLLGRSVRDAFKSVFRNFSLSLASISCITITLIIVALSIVASYNIENFTKVIEKDLTAVVFLETGVTEEDIESIKTKLDTLQNVESFTFISKKEVQEQMQKESEVFDTLMSQWKEGDSPLKDTFNVKVKEITEISKTAAEIEKLDKVDVVRYGEGMVERLVRFFNIIEKVAYAAVIALVVVTVFLIINTIKLTIFSRKREIGIMRLVGASNFSIKMPFIIEGMVLGVIGSIIPILLVTYGYLIFYNNFDGFLFTELIQLIKPEPFIYQASIIVLCVGIIVGMIGSASAVRKYLKV